MRKLLILLLMILTMFKIVANEVDTTPLPVQAEDWWYELSDQEKWELFRIHFNNELLLYEDLKANNKNLKNADKIIANNIEFLKKYKPFYPKFAIRAGCGVIFGVTEKRNFNIDFLINGGADIYFLKGRLFINPAIIVKPYMNYGGGLSFSIGVTF